MLLGYALILLLLAIDQLTKQLARIYLMAEGQTIVWIPSLLELKYFENDGMSFNLLSGQQGLFFVITIIALLIFGYLFKDIDFKSKKVYSISVVFFIAGTLGNAIDRLIYGFVIDFLHYPFLDLPLSWVGLNNFYNNIADMLLSAALVMFAIDLFFFEGKRTKKEVITDENIEHKT
jgi:signal peptidase II